MSTQKQSDPIPEDVAFTTIKEGLGRLDAERAGRLDRLQHLHAVQQATLQREQKRLKAKYGSEHPRVQRLDARLQYDARVQADLKAERERLDLDVPETGAAVWLMHGRVLDGDGAGRDGLTVSFRDEKDNRLPRLGHACTDAQGYFALRYTQEEDTLPPDRPVTLVVTNKEKQVLHREVRPLYVRLGQIDYREIVLQDTTPCPPPDEPPAEDLVPVDVTGLDVPKQIRVREPAQFSATINDNASEPLTLTWDFGDETTATGLTAQHTYTEEGIYLVTFTASNRGSTDSMTQRVQVVAPPDVAGIDAHPPEPAARTPVRFTAQVQGTAPLTYHWDLGDGTESEVEHPEHRYDEPGDYTITLQVENAAGAADATVQISVKKSRGRRSRRND